MIVAEKPSVARDLARVLGIRPVGEHCFEGDGRVITWCIGHLVELDEPAAYDARWKSWRLETLPMLPAEFRLRPAKHAVAQLRTVTRLLADRRFATVVNACDAGREGELIFHYVYRYAGGGPRVLRLWISSLTDEAIRRGFAALRPGGQMEPLADAARSRSEADWLVGMNATRAITARGRTAGHAALYSIGRVQTPTLAMLVARERAVRAFVPRPYWEVRGAFRTAAGQRFEAGWRFGRVARLGAAALAEAVCARDRALGAGRVERVRARTVREPAPLLFDLTSLQRTANRRFGWAASRTLELAQALYERHKLLTYPRTDSRHLTSDVVPELPALFAALAGVPEYAPFAGELLAHPPRPGRRIVDDAKVSDHHAIIPTGRAVRLDALDRDERRLFDLVARRFLGAFYPDAEFAVTEAWIRVGGGGAPGDAAAGAPGDVAGARGDVGAAPGPQRSAEADAEAPILERLPPMPDRYLARGRVRVAAGWQAVAGIEGGEERRPRTGADDAEPAALLPPLVEGQLLDGAFSPAAKQTTPPPRYTEATLLGAMESAGASIDDEALRRAMKDCGLGTPATRAAIIETLLKRDYITREKQHLVPTETGLALIAALPVASLASPELTGQWEARLARIARGEESRAAFMADIARYVRELVDATRGWTPPAAPTGDAARVGPCPRCGADVAARPRDFACTGACGFAIRNRIAGRAISADLAGLLLEKRRSQILRGFRSRAGRMFAAALVLDEAGELRFDFGADRSGAGRAAGPPDVERADDATHPTGSDGEVSPERPRGGHRRRRKGAPASAPSRSAGARLADRPRRVSRPRATVAVEPATAAADLGCPRCRAGALIAGSRGWGCSRWRDGCGFVVWFQTAGRRLSAAQLRDLVTRGKTRKARFVSGNGTEIDGRLVLDPAADGGAARFVPA